ncbi:cell division protein [Enterococcus thailandicus]|uniref:cell division protein n=1 Tax=Enterococcus thailandicus TaxID=417368 RepID=UPI0022EBA4DB|nr:cell division protein [Enterococcus thailandicus]MDA3974390.1 cell division protein [Enterococcus thailandicus]MDA3976877.1 cell division protein [Enterococcus thailandicus]MDA3981843.1 cell division protein [Enterococcus thailandicus]
MKPKITREEVEQLLVSDAYFEKKNYALKFFQTLVAVFGWICVVTPFIWLLLPFISPEKAWKNHLVVYKDELQTLKFLFIFLSIMFVAIAITFITLTIWNNFQFKNLLQKQIQYDEERLAKRRQLLRKEFDSRFGPTEFRKEICSYSVKEEQNLETNFVRDLYKKGGVEL